MRVCEQVLVVEDYGGENEDVLACCDGFPEAKQARTHFEESLPDSKFTLCRVRIVEVIA